MLGKRSFKQVSWLVVAAMLAVIVGCGGGAGSEGSAKPPASASAGGSPSASGSPAAPEPITLSFWGPTLATNYTPGIQDDPVAQEIERQTGVKIKFDAGLGDAQKTQVIIASGDLPDIMVVDNPDNIEPLIKSGSIIDMQPYLDNAPNIKKYASKAMQYSKFMYSGGEDKLYVLPARAKEEASPIPTGYYGTFLRWDQYKSIGMPEIKGLDSLVDIAAEMVKKYPTTPDGQKVYGLYTWLEWGNAQGYAQPVMALIGQQAVDTKFNHFNYKVQDNAFIELLDDRNAYWRGASMFNRAHRLGILDPESFTQKYETANAKGKAGRVALHFYQWDIVDGNATLNQQTNGKDAYVMLLPEDTAEYPVADDRAQPFGFNTRQFVVSAKSKHPERAIALIDYLYSQEGTRTILSGVKDTHWIEENGVARLSDAFKNIKTEDPDYKSKTGIRKYDNYAGLPTMPDANGKELDLFQDPELLSESYNEATRDYLKHFGQPSELGVYTMRKNKSTINAAYASLVSLPTDEIKRIGSNIDAYITKEMPKLIMASSEAAYAAQKEKMFADIRGMGYDEYKAFYEAAWQKALTDYEQF